MARVSYLGIAAAVFALPGAAAAGPIHWGLNATLMGTGQYDSLFNLSGYSPDLTGYLTTGGSIHEDVQSRLVSADTPSAWGWRTVTVGAVVPDGPGYAPGYEDISNVFHLGVTIRDLASGQAGTLTYSGRAREQDVTDFTLHDQITNRHAGINDLSPSGERDLLLGGNNYHVTVAARSDQNGSAYLDAAVTVGAVNATPEPGTLLMCGVGLAASCGVGFRRRIAHRSARNSSWVL